MDSAHPLRHAATFASACLAMIWLGGSLGAAGFKAVFWLLFGVWPETALYTLMPAATLQLALSLPEDNLLGKIIFFVARLDILTIILVGPPLLLLPCLALALSGRSPMPKLLRRPPFASPGGNKAPLRIDPIFRRHSGLTGPPNEFPIHKK